MKKIVWFWMFTLMALGCVRTLPEPEVRTEIPFPEGERVEVSFTVTGAGLTPATRALGEEGIYTMHLAVFGSSGYLKEYVKATNLTEYQQDGRTCYRFGVSLTLSESPRTIHFIGNGPASLPFGDAKAILPNLMTEIDGHAYWQMVSLENGIRAYAYDGSGSFSYVDDSGVRRDVAVTSLANYIRMEGSSYVYLADSGVEVKVDPGDYIRKDGTKVTNGTGYMIDLPTSAALNNVPMVRNCAKIVISAAADANLTPISFATVNVPRRGTVVPFCAAIASGFVPDYLEKDYSDLRDMGYLGNLPAGTPFSGINAASIPSASDFENCTGGVVPAPTETSPGGSIYVYERPVPTRELPPTSVIVYGTYVNEEDDVHSGKNYYYKIDLYESDTEAGTSNYYPLYRNFKYQINLRKIRSRGFDDPLSAAMSIGSAEVSADISASHLPDISDGVARLVIQPWMSQTFTRKQTDNQQLHAFYFTDVYSQNPDMTEGSVTVEALPGMDDIITAVSISGASDGSDGNPIGCRTITFSTCDVEDGSMSRSQQIRISGLDANTHNTRLYRDITITIQPRQPMEVRCGQSEIPGEKGQSQWLTISIPDHLAESMFPLDFTIEPEDMTLTPDNTIPDNNLPVVSAPSISEHEGYTGKPTNTFQFVRTLTWEEYSALDTRLDADGFTWRELKCWFRTTREENATTIWVANEFFFKGWDQFTNELPNHFKNLAITSSLRRGGGQTVPIHFEVAKNPRFPVITFTVTGMTPAFEGATEIAPGTYRYETVTRSQDWIFITTTDNAEGNVSLTLTADDYADGSVVSRHFSDYGFVDGKNVVHGMVNSLGNKDIRFGYCDETEQYAAVSLVGDRVLELLTPQGISFPWTPTGPYSEQGDVNYHEINLKTRSDLDESIEFVLSAPGYVEESVRADRFKGDIRNWKDNAYTTTFNLTAEGNRQFNVTLNEAQCSVSLDGYTMAITSRKTDDQLFYVEMTFADGAAPASATVQEGSGDNYHRFPGKQNCYVWSVSPAQGSTITFTPAAPGGPITIQSLVFKTFKPAN